VMLEGRSRSKDVEVDGLEGSEMTGPGGEISTASELGDDAWPRRDCFPGDEASSGFSVSTPRVPGDDDNFPSRRKRCMRREISMMSTRYDLMLEEYGSRTCNLFDSRSVVYTCH
jgi:hypothetical protein